VRLVAGDRRLEDASVVLSFWRKLARAGATIIDDDEVDGRRVWVVEVPREPSSDSPSDLRIFAVVDRRTFLPLRIRRESRTPGWSTAIRVHYGRLDRSAAPPHLFKVRRP